MEDCSALNPKKYQRLSSQIIMLDEAHERTVQIDIIMGLMKKILRKRPDLRVIISSATVDAEYIRDFFNDNYNESLNSEKKSNNATVLSVQGIRVDIK